MSNESAFTGSGRLARAALLAGVVLASAACGSKKATAKGPLTYPAGTALAAAEKLTVDPATGGSLASDDGVLTIVVPAGAVSTPTEFSVQRITNTAPGVGTSYRVGPTGMAFAQLVTLTFRPSVAGTPIAGLSVMTRDPATGFWTAVTQNLVVDGVAGTLTVTLSTIAVSDFALVAAATANDFYGVFTLASTIEYPISATGAANLAYAGSSGSVSWYVVPGYVAVAAPVPVGAATCTATPASVPLPTSVAELDLGRGRFDFGISGRWDATCSDGTPRILTAVFDTLGVNLVACGRPTAVGTPVVAADHLSGSMVSDCGGGRTATATWDFRTCPSAAGTACLPSFCHTSAAIFCDTGGPVCNDTAAAPDGTACGVGGACLGGACSACTAGASCVPANPCHTGTLACSPAPACTDTGVSLPDGSACEAGKACLAGACAACVAGADCVPANPCHVGSLVCSPTPFCTDTGVLRSDGTACNGGQACISGTCGTCVAGAACVPANPCDVGSLVCSPATGCTDTLVPVRNGTACPAGQVCLAGACVAKETITGARFATYWTDPPSEQAPPTLEQITAPDAVAGPAPTVRIADGAGGWVTYGSGVAFVNGSFSISGVPTGASYVVEYVLPDGVRVYADAASTSLDLGYDVLGRRTPPLATPAADTLVTFTLDGPWTGSGDEVQMASSSADLWDVLLPSAPIAAGSPATFVENWRTSQSAGLPLHLLAAGDTLWLHQLAIPAPAPATSYLSAVAATSITGIALVDGSPAAVGGTLLATTQTGTAAVDWDLPKFESYLPDMLPAGATATSSGHLLVVAASPYALASPAPPPTAGSPELLVVSAATGSVATGSTLALGNLAYGQFLPAWWLEWQRAAFTARVDYTAPGAQDLLSEGASVVRADPMSPTPPSPIVPAVSPVRAPAIATSAGQTTISWTAPAVPTSPPAPSYRVEVFWLRAEGTTSVSSPVLRYLTSSTQVVIPAGVLTPGSSYYARITAELPGAAGSAPFRRAAAQSAASALTGVFVP
jgi:hypothetical protein